MRIERTSPPTRTGLRASTSSSAGQARWSCTTLARCSRSSCSVGFVSRSTNFLSATLKIPFAETEEYVSQMASWSGRARPSSPVRRSSARRFARRRRCVSSASSPRPGGAADSGDKHDPGQQGERRSGTPRAKQPVNGRLKLQLGTVDVQSAGFPRAVEPPTCVARDARRRSATSTTRSWRRSDTGEVDTAYAKVFDPGVRTGGTGPDRAATLTEAATGPIRGPVHASSHARPPRRTG